ncbi:MAG: DNA primase [Euryarchaeota archaeon]|nr:DNA primase [Euryarchaeota archaeon]
MTLDPSTTKYLIKAKISADGIVEKPDVVGAIFGQTEGLLGEELDLRDMQKSGRIGRIEVEISSNKGKAEGEILIPSSLDQVETSILAASLETIDRVGPCKAYIGVLSVEDVRMSKRTKIIDRAKELLTRILEDSKSTSEDLTEAVKQSIQIQEIMTYGTERLPAGPNIDDSDSIIVVEGRNDVVNLLKAGIKNAIAVEGTNVPKTVQELSKERTVTAFVDGDRGGELVLKELLQVAEIDFVARAPPGKEVEELTNKQIMKALRNKVPADQANAGNPPAAGPEPPQQERPEQRRDDRRDQPRDNRDRGDRRGGRDRRGRDGRDEDREFQPAPAQQPPQPKVEKTLTDEQRKYFTMLKELSGSSKARLVGPTGEVIGEMEVKDLADSLKANPREVAAIVFDGVVSQRLMDIAAELGIKDLVGSKMGSVAKYPNSVHVWLRSDFE